MELVVSILMLLVAAGSFLISLLAFIRQLIDDKINKK
ncbi:putative holin-like toxin [Ornithinibacillus bavariensis]|nr:putative holin-like toxin [Ornithinibacillus bavariensis]